MPEARVAFVTLGCKVNQTESEAIAAALGVAAAHESDDADVIVVNTCTVTAEADRKARKTIRHALGLPRSPTVIVTGCLAALDAPGVAGLGKRVVVEADKEQVVVRVRAALEGRSVVDAGSNVARRSRVQLKVEDGCDQYCTYCIVPYARGLPRPVPFDRVVEEASRLVAEGASEIVLTGINIGRYAERDRGLPELVRAVAATGVTRLRLSSIEPGDVNDELLEAAADTPAFCRHLHVPLQSGSDAVLARMGRPYDGASFAAVLERARAVLPGLAVTTDVIVGFPGETGAEFAETLEFVESRAFSRLHVFRYSRRPGTPAAAMPGQVPAEVKARRSSALRSLGERLACGYACSRSGGIDELLVERVVERDGKLFAEGTTREYLRLAVSLDDESRGIEPGALLPVRVECPFVGQSPRGRLVR